MKNFVRSNRDRFAVTLMLLAVTFGLVACGGGGGGGATTPVTPPFTCTLPQVLNGAGTACVTPVVTCTAPQVLNGDGTACVTPVPVTFTVTCPNGASQMAATQAQAEAACPLPTMLSIAPTNLSITTSPIGFPGIIVATDSVLDPASLVTGNVTLKVGSLTNITGTVSATDTKGFKFTPTGTLNYGQVYDFVANVKDTLGRILAVRSSFSTALISCTAPQVANSAGNACVNPTCTLPQVWNGTACAVPVTPTCTAPALWNASVNACIYPVGVQKVGPATELPASITKVTDAAFLAATITGEVLLIDIGAKATNAPVVTDRTRDIVFAVYRWSGYYVEKPLFKDTLRSIDGYNGMIESALAGTSITDRFQGSVDGIFVRAQPGNKCYLVVWDTLSVGFGPVLSSACPVWN